MVGLRHAGCIHEWLTERETHDDRAEISAMPPQ